MDHDIIKMKQALVGPRLVDQPEPYGLGTRERWFRNPPAKMCRERAAFPLLNFGRVSLIQVCLRTRHARHYAIIGEICDNWAPVVGVKQHDMFAAAGSRQRSPRVIYATWDVLGRLFHDHAPRC